MRCEKYLKNASRGMTLIEVIFVMAILSVVMLAVMSLYIPAQRSTVVQSQVTDVQTNLQLAVKRLTQDLLTAGFLVTGQPIIFQNGANNPADFTIRTRLVGRGFGRLSADPAGNVLTLSLGTMTDDFPTGSLVQIINPVSAITLGGVYSVTGRDKTARTVTLDAMPADVSREDVLIRVTSATPPDPQTIRYRFADSDGDGAADALVRIVNGNTQFLARNVSAVNFGYDYTTTSSPKVRRVNLTLTGQTGELVAGDAVAGVKTSSLQTSFMLRNVF